MHPHTSLVKPCVLVLLTLLALFFSACSGVNEKPKESARAPEPSASDSQTTTQSPHSSPSSTPQSMEELNLERIQEKETTLLLEATLLENMDVDEKHRRLIDVVQMYETFTTRFPDSELGFIFYGKLLRKIGMNKKANNMFFRANKINPNIAVVKQQIGNFLSEEGMFELALPYFMSAIDLEPQTALYHYQLGELLYTYYEAYLSKKVFDRKTLDKQMTEAFKRAAELAPDEHTYAFRYAESFYDIENANWDKALNEWQKLFEKAKTDRERDIIRLHQARVYIISGRYAFARPLLATINQPTLEKARQELLLQVK